MDAGGREEVRGKRKRLVGRMMRRVKGQARRTRFATGCCSPKSHAAQSRVDLHPQGRAEGKSLLDLVHFFLNRRHHYQACLAIVDKQPLANRRRVRRWCQRQAQSSRAWRTWPQKDLYPRWPSLTSITHYGRCWCPCCSADRRQDELTPRYAHRWVDTHVDTPIKRKGNAINKVVDRHGQPLSFFPHVP